MKNIDLKSEIINIKNKEIYNIETTGRIIPDDDTKKRKIYFDKSLVTGNFKDITGRNITFDSNPYNIVSFIEVSSEIELTVDNDVSISPPSGGSGGSGGSLTQATLIIPKDSELESHLDAMINILSASNSHELSNYYIPTQNDWFSQNEKFSTILIQNSSAFKEVEFFDNRILKINNFIDEFNGNLEIYKTLRVDILTLKPKLEEIISHINKIHTDIAEYYVKLKKLVMNFKLTDFKIAEKQSDAILDTRTAEDTSVINSNFEYYQENGQKAYNKKRSEDIYAIKLD